MGTLVYRPANQQGSTEVRQGATIYEFDPGVPKFVPAEHYAAVRTMLQSLGGNLVSPTPTVATQAGGAAGATSYSYQVVAFNDNGDTLPSGTTVWATGNASLIAPNGNAISWANVMGAKGYKVIRTAGGGSQGQIASVPTGTLSFTDNGGAASPYTPAGAAVGVTSVVSGPSEE